MVILALKVVLATCCHFNFKLKSIKPLFEEQLCNHGLFSFFSYKFPKTFLSSHFWSLQQKSQFAIELQKKRLVNQRPVLRHLQSQVASIRDEKLREMCREVLFKLGSGTQPSLREIMRIKPLFESDPFSIKAMHGPHVVTNYTYTLNYKILKR